MKVWEVEYKKTRRNKQDRSGNWFNYYEAETKEEALEKFGKDAEMIRGLKDIVAVKLWRDTTRATK